MGLRAGFGERFIAVVLFGSHARGDHRSDSDWDLLVIAEGLPQSPLDRSLEVTKHLPHGMRGAISALTRTREEFESRLPALYLDIAIDGRILYDPSGYATERLATVRRIIEKVGLYRQRTPAADIWQWRDPPQGAWSVEWDS